MLKMKKLISFLVAVVMAFSLVSAVAVPASAEIIASGTTGDCTWTLEDTVLTISGNGAMADYVYDNPWYGSSYCKIGKITEIIIESGVTHIGNTAFEGFDDLTDVTIPDSVTSIGSSAFYNCWKLKNIAIPDSVTSIGYSAFSQSGLTSITVPGSITEISYAAFDDDFYMESATICQGVTSIGVQAFYGNENLQNIFISDSVISIEDIAFSNCGVTSITIPDSVTFIGQAFICCHNLEEIVFEGDAPTFDGGIIPYYEFATSYWDSCRGDCNRLYGEQITRNVKVYYPANNSTWTEKVMQECIGWNPTLDVIWIPYEVEEDKNTVEEWNVSLEDALQVNFYLDAGIAETETVTVTVGEKAYTAAISALAKDEDGRFVVSVPVAAPQMKDEITVQVPDAEPAVYSVRQYCDTILADESKSQYHQLVKEMLNYGAMAQNYFGYNTESLANEGITDVGVAEVPETAADMIISDEIDDIAFYGASLVYRDRIAVRYYFTGDVSNAIFTVNGTFYTPVAKDGVYYIEVADILPQNLEQQITLMVQDNSGNTLTVTYGPMNYIVRMNQNGSKETKALIKALYNYHLAAKALCEEIV